MDLSTWLIYLMAAIGLSLSPGPNGLLALTHGALHGRRKALYTIFGGAFGFVAVIALSMYGIGALLKTSLVWLTVLKWVGGAYLVWLGIQVWRSPPIGFEVAWFSGTQSRLVALPARRTLGADQSQGASLLRCFSSAVHRPCAKPLRPVRHHGGNVCSNRNSDGGVHRQHGPPDQSMASASWAALQPGVRWGVRGDRGRAAASQLSGGGPCPGFWGILQRRRVQ